jgi:hypothetical protein
MYIYSRYVHIHTIPHLRTDPSFGLRTPKAGNCDWAVSGAADLGPSDSFQVANGLGATCKFDF